MKKVLNTIIWTGLIAYIFIALGFTADKRSEVLCRELRVIIADSSSAQFFDKRDVERILKSGHRKKIRGTHISELNTRELEALFSKNPYIKKIEVYTTVDGVLCIRVRQRTPVIHVIASNGAGYYLDKDGYILPASRKYTPYLLVANGSFFVGDQFKRSECLDSIPDKKFYKPWFEVLELADFINGNSFWSSQIVQLYLNSKQDFEIIPRVGAHQIILGRAEGYETKFSNLEILYEEGLKKEGWNNYQKIDLRFKNQVICTKR
jgi:cell division protein FtsQ